MRRTLPRAILALGVLLALSSVEAFGDTDAATDLGETAGVVLSSEECVVVAKENEEIRARLQELTYVNGQLKVDAKMRKRRESSLLRTARRLKRKVKKLTGRAHDSDDLASMNDELNKRNDGMIKTNTELADRTSKLEGNVKADQEQLTELQKQLKAQKNDLDGSVKQVGEKTRVASKLSEKLAAAISEDERLRHMVNATTGELNQNSEAYKAKLKSKMDQIHQDDMSIHDLKGALAKARVRQEHLEAKQGHLKKLHVDLEQRNHALQTEITDLKTTYADSAKKQKERDTEMLKLETTITDLKAQIAKAAADASAGNEAKQKADAAKTVKERAAKALEATDRSTVEAVDADNVINAIEGSDNP